MIEIITQVNHQLGRQTASEKMRDMVFSLSQRFPQQVHQIKVQLTDDHFDVRFAAYGYLVHWIADVREDCVALKVEIPDSAGKFRNKIEQAIVTRIEENLAPRPSTRAA